ncbi:hypothetical protein [Labilithrix luteola]|uniref:hypothetical protein n=1 Tax=Labilithrix luteola TaxID=1391654 RepID=UPI000AB5929E|nr:hypothetical protein [Labilithrix luteola]
MALHARPAHATGAILASASESGPTEIDVQLAVAPTTQGTTRWTRITTAGTHDVMWLVPVRPGARIDWAPAAWLDALDETTAPRIATRSSALCPVSYVERATSWATTGPASAPSPLLVHDTESDARAHAAARGYRVTADLGSRITDVYAHGEVLVSVELADAGAPPGTRFSSPTLRVSDDAGPTLPFALTNGGSVLDARLTVFAFGNAPKVVGATEDVDPNALFWTASRNNYGAVREKFFETSDGTRWLRESASHQVLFAGVSLPDATSVPSLAETYFRATASSPAACEASAKSASLMQGALGHACAAGALARVGGGIDCVPEDGTIPAITMTCGDADDLALALSGLSPSRAFVTRLAGIVPLATPGTDAVLANAGSASGPIYYAPSNDCVTEPSPAPTPSFTDPSPPASAPGPSGSYVVASDGCGGSTVSSSDESDTSTESSGSSDDSCGGSDSSSSNDGSGWDSSDSSSSDDSCSSSSDKKSSSDDSGWDSKDDSSDSCSGSGGGCSSTSGKGGDDEGWDENSATPKTRSTKVRPTKKSSLGPRRKRGSSPVSRLAIFVVAIVLPLRRRARKISF